MNMRFLFLVSLTISSTILGMDPRLRAQIRQWEREQVQAELQKAIETEKQRQNEALAYDMTLTNGYKLPLGSFLDECSHLEKLRKDNYEIFAELVKKSQNSNYRITDETIREYLTTEWFIVPEDGKVQQTVHNIILCGVHEENGIFMLYDPSSVKKSRHLLDPKQGAFPAGM